MALVINMGVGSTLSYEPFSILMMAIYTNTPVTTQMSKTEKVAPITSARCHPKLIFLVEGRLESHIAKKEIINDAKSAKRWATSVAVAKLSEYLVPIDSMIIKSRHGPAAMVYFRIAFLSIPVSLSV